MSRHLYRPAAFVAILATAVGMVSPALADGVPYEDPTPTSSSSDVPEYDYILEVGRGEDVDVHADWLLDQLGVGESKRDDRIARKWDCAINGEWIRLTEDEAAQARDIENEPNVISFAEAPTVQVEPQFTPYGDVYGMEGSADTQGEQIVPTSNQRVGWTEGASGVGVNVAVLDTGVDASRDDLMVVGGYNATLDSRGENGWGIDDYGHATWVAGQIAALDNDRGVVGIAPGALIYSVPVLSQGSGSYASILNGVDWVCQQNSDADPNNDISVVNLSLGGGNLPSTCDPATLPDDCGSWDAMHNAFYTLHNMGVIVSVSAGNDSVDAVQMSPANYRDSVVTVSALTDYDGKPGGLAVPPDGYDIAPDDVLAPFSDYGSVVDFIAPGVYDYGLTPLNTTMYASGTSMASPVVAGVMAEYVARCGVGGDDAVNAVLNWSSQPGWVRIDGRWTGDVGVDQEPLVRFGAPCAS